MEFMYLLFVVGIAGGLVIAIVLRTLGVHRQGWTRSDAFAERSGVNGSDVINVSSIKVAGLGGLGLVGVSFTLAWTFPRIGQTMLLGAILGAAMAAFWIYRRRRIGPLPTSSGRLGANTTLSIDQPADGTTGRAPESSNRDSRPVRLATGRV